MPKNPILSNRPNQALTFNQQYHRETINKGTAKINDDGSVTTAFVKGFTLDDGKTYNIPTFNNDTGKLMSNKEAIQKFLPAIKSGAIQGFDSTEEADRAASREHKLMTEEAEESLLSTVNSVLK